MMKHECTLTFKNFYIALAYLYEHLSLDNFHSDRDFIKKNRIAKIYLVPVWDTFCAVCDSAGEEKSSQRAKHTIDFLMKEFCSPKSNLDRESLQLLEHFFDVFPVPTPFAVLRKERQGYAKRLFEQNRNCVIVAGHELLQSYLKHRELDKTPSGECSKAGYGLVLSLDFDDSPRKINPIQIKNPVSDDPKWKSLIDSYKART